MPRRLVTLLLLLFAAVPGVAAQSDRVVMLPRASEVLGPRADDMRRQFREVMNLYPPDLGRVLRLDPALMTNPQYLAPYPALAEILKEHPEIARYPGYFLDYVHLDWTEERAAASPEVQRTWEVVRMWRDVMTGLFVLLLIGTFSAAIVTLVKHFVAHRRWLRATKLQSEFHNRLLERMGSSSEVLAYAQSSGRDLLPPLPLQETRTEIAAPFGRILWSVQAGVVAAAAGVGLLVVKQYVVEEVAQMLLTLGVLILSLGIGFALAAAASYMLSQRLGLLAPARPADRREPLGG